MNSEQVHAQITSHIPFAKKLAREAFFRTGCLVPLDELVSCAFLGLTQAAGRFDANTGISFAAFSASRIKGAIIDGMKQFQGFEAIDGLEPAFRDRNFDRLEMEQAALEFCRQARGADAERVRALLLEFKRSIGADLK